MTKRVATYRDIEVELVQQSTGAVWAVIVLPAGQVTLEARTETIAISEAKIHIDKRYLGLLRPATD
jgi:hypothetical protein